MNIKVTQKKTPFSHLKLLLLQTQQRTAPEELMNIMKGIHYARAGIYQTRVIATKSVFISYSLQNTVIFRNFNLNH